MSQESPRSNGERASKRLRTETTYVNDDVNGVEVEEDGPACNSCRRRKAKCSRQQPCSQCERLNVECLYHEKRARSGMKVGAVEALTQRITHMEQMFLGQSLLLRPFLDRSLGHFGSQSLEEPDLVDNSDRSSIDTQLQHVRSGLLQLAQHDIELGSTAVLKRHEARPAATDENDIGPQTPSYEASLLLPEHILDILIDYYFESIHPWIPILHPPSFKSRLREVGGRHKLETILLAIVSITQRFRIEEIATAHRVSVSKCRERVIMRSMEEFSVENLQALVIVAFDIIGSGRGPSAWSVVGSMTRTVEQLRLSVEDDEQVDDPSRGYFIRRMNFLRPAASWMESEERRRVFWNVFLMDRFCSVATGWNNGLTGQDVRRRLPCEGALWNTDAKVQTPYFGIAAENPRSTLQATTPTSERLSTNDEENDAIGGFAFCIEATESLNLVTTFFLRHAVDFKNTQAIQVWLLQFKDLDLRLIKWRLYLPQKWRNASVLNSAGIMDPNLTLAHITHNTAVIQLHQCIAYPSPQWRLSGIRPPSAGSAETCTSAALEISRIAQQYLRSNQGITNPQFSFCLFIAGRVLLAHAIYYSVPMLDEFHILIASLKEISVRWAGLNCSSASNTEADDLAMAFAKRLERGFVSSTTVHRKADQELPLDLRQPVYSDQLINMTVTAHTPQPSNETTSMMDNEVQHDPEMGLGAIYPGAIESAASISLAYPPLPPSFEQLNGSLSWSNVPVFGDDGLGSRIASNTHLGLSRSKIDDLQMLFEGSFEQGLRVSTYEGQ